MQKNADPDTFFSFKENHQYFSLSLKGNFKLLKYINMVLRPVQANSQVTF